MAKLTLKLLVMMGGAGVGFPYYYLVGCSSGVCPITSHPVSSTLYGGLLGFLVSLLITGKPDH